MFPHVGYLIDGTQGINKLTMVFIVQAVQAIQISGKLGGKEIIN